MAPDHADAGIPTAPYVIRIGGPKGQLQGALLFAVLPTQHLQSCEEVAKLEAGALVPRGPRLVLHDEAPLGVEVSKERVPSLGNPWC
jgi:hypothetical protein